MGRKSETSSTRRATSPASCTPKSETRPRRMVMTERPIRRIAVIGTGVIGASWTALFLAKGMDVVATDIAPDAEASLRRFVDMAWPAMKRLGLAPNASQSRLTFTADLVTAVKGADLVQENGPERIEFKRELYGQLDGLLAPDVIIASSSSGLTMSEIQTGCPSHPERCLIRHPFNPPHLVPLVEIVGGAKTSEDTIRRATEFYTALGKRTVRLHKEVPGHVANRLQAALAREVYHLVAEGVVSVADVDTALGHHGTDPSQSPRRRSRRYRALFPTVHPSYYGLVESSRFAPVDARTPAKAHRRRTRRGGIAIHRWIGGGARRGAAWPSGAAHAERAFRSAAETGGQRRIRHRPEGNSPSTENMDDRRRY